MVSAPSTSIFSGFLPQWFVSTSPIVPPPPMSNVFESHDCIWYYGTLYVKEAVAVSRIHQCSVAEPVELVELETDQEPEQESVEPETDQVHSYDYNCNAEDDDDETESVCSNSSNHNNTHNYGNINNSTSAFKPQRNIGKQNQLKHLKDGIRLRHLILINRASHEWNEWFATFDAHTNRIIRTSDGVAFDTLRQFSRLHCNEVDSSFTSANVWADLHFQYQDEDGQWHPLANLKKK